MVKLLKANPTGQETEVVRHSNRLETHLWVSQNYLKAKHNFPFMCIVFLNESFSALAACSVKSLIALCSDKMRYCRGSKYCFYFW